jgi:hypothetical protein
MKAQKKAVTADEIDGIPRTADEAKRRRHKKVKVDFDGLNAREKKKWTTIASADAAHGDIGRIGPNPGGGQIVCYYDANTGNYDICHIVP